MHLQFIELYMLILTTFIESTEFVDCLRTQVQQYNYHYYLPLS